MAYSRKVSINPGDSPNLVQIMVGKFEWMQEGSCNIKADPTVNPDWWFPSTGESKEFDAKAKSVCDGCPVKRKCLDFANENDEFGTWGGKTWEERQHDRAAEEADE